ncbi:MAG: flagellar hook-associated protein FlgK, partial [Spirochaetia bacterium]|nr:flagellar hook-associated protein FlgK [Spirochaetia bacterium]
PSAYLQVSDDVARDPASVAAARGRDVGGTGDYNTPNGTADGSNALLIAASMKQGSRMIGHARNPEEFYNALISQLGTESRTAEDAATRQKDNLTSLTNLRQSTMGVSLDEEMSNMVQFQQSYNAAARMMNTMNEMIQQILRLGMS